MRQYCYFTHLSKVVTEICGGYISFYGHTASRRHNQHLKSTGVHAFITPIPFHCVELVTMSLIRPILSQCGDAFEPSICGPVYCVSSSAWSLQSATVHPYHFNDSYISMRCCIPIFNLESFFVRNIH